MKIYFQNKAVKLSHSILGLVCPECLFYRISPCPFGTSTILDCDSKGGWINEASVDIFTL